MRHEYRPLGHVDFKEITTGDVLTWELQLKREGTLPPDVQRRLLEHLFNRPVSS